MQTCQTSDNLAPDGQNSASFPFDFALESSSLTRQPKRQDTSGHLSGFGGKATGWRPFSLLFDYIFILSCQPSQSEGRVASDYQPVRQEEDQGKLLVVLLLFSLFSLFQLSFVYQSRGMQPFSTIDALVSY